MNKVKPRILLGSVVCIAAVFVALAGAGLYSLPSKAQAAVPGSAMRYSQRARSAGCGASGRPDCL